MSHRQNRNITETTISDTTTGLVITRIAAVLIGSCGVPEPHPDNGAIFDLSSATTVTTGD